MDEIWQCVDEAEEIDKGGGGGGCEGGRCKGGVEKR